MAMTKKGAHIPRVCGSCGVGLQIERHTSGSSTYNELELTLFGGYGSFIDDISHQGGLPYTFTLCEALTSSLHSLSLRGARGHDQGAGAGELDPPPVAAG